MPRPGNVRLALYRCLLAALFLTTPPALLALDVPKSQAQRQQLKERDRLVKEVERLRQAGQFADAIPAAEKVLAIEREVFGNVHEAVLGSVDRLGSLRLLTNDFAGGRAMRQEALVLCTKLRGPDHYTVTDARLRLADVALLEGMA